MKRVDEDGEEEMLISCPFCGFGREYDSSEYVFSPGASSRATENGSERRLLVGIDRTSL
jgi:hypothetical protein